MKARSCPNCGAPLVGSGRALDGLCPKCLVAGVRCEEPSEELAGVLHDSGAGVDAIDAVEVAGLADSPDVQPVALAGPVEAVTGEPGLKDSDRVVRELQEELNTRRLATPQSERPPSPLPRIDGYDVVREVKHGGQGIVYLAIQRSTKRKVAVKLLLEGRYASKAARKRFEREIELAASLKHPNVIAVFDSGTTADGHEFYVMDYVRGLPITEYVRNKKLGLSQVLSLFATVCDAVNHAHQRGVIHRDIKPANVMVDADGNVRVLDFGLAKTLSGPVESLVSVTGNVVGTLPYMSPEQTRGNPDEIDTRTDVYALGVILYELLTGKHPYPVEGELAAVMRHISETPPAPPARTWTSESGVSAAPSRGLLHGRPSRCPLDADVQTVVLKALAKERDRRYDSAGELARDIRRYLASEPIVARRPSAWYQLRMFARRNKPLVAGASATLFVLVMAVVMRSVQLAELRGLYSDLNVAHEKTIADAALIGDQLASAGDEAAELGDLITAHLLYMKRLEHAHDLGQAGSSILMGLLETAAREGGQIPLMGSYGRGGGVGGFRGHTRAPTSVAVLRQKRLAITSSNDGRLILWDLLTGRMLGEVPPQPVRPGAEALAYVDVSERANLIATAGKDGTVRLRRVDPFGEPVATLDHAEPDKRPQIWMVAISADGTRILTGTNDRRIFLWDGSNGWEKATRQLVGEIKESVAALAFLPGDSRFAISGDGHGYLRLWDLESRTEVWDDPPRPRTHAINCVAFSDDGSRLVSADFGGYMIVWDVSGAGADTKLDSNRYHPMEHERRLWRAAFSPDGKRVASVGADGTATVWDVRTAHPMRRFNGQSRDSMGVAFLDDRTVVSTGDETFDAKAECLASALRVWDMDDEGGLAGGAAVNGKVASISVNDDGVVDLVTDKGPAKLQVGRDGRLHPYPAKAPAISRGPAKGRQRPAWGAGGRDTAAAAAAGKRLTEDKVLVTLSGGKLKLVAGAGATLELWGVPKSRRAEAPGTLLLLRSFRGHSGNVAAAAVSPGGRYLVSADDRGGVRIWDLMRPLECRDLQREMARAHEKLQVNPADKQGLAVFLDWYAFWGRDLSEAELRPRARLAAKN
jgi:serine/threonine protein kinase/WD40 repeat protein